MNICCILPWEKLPLGPRAMHSMQASNLSDKNKNSGYRPPQRHHPHALGSNPGATGACPVQRGQEKMYAEELAS